MGRLEQKRISDAIRRAAVRTSPAPKPENPDNLERIKTITQTARGIWFGYLGALAFAGVTLLGVEDVDFFSLDNSTQLPLIGVGVPVTSFFWAGALLITVIYCYLHVFLEQLWVELANAPTRTNDRPLAENIHPWLISELALIARRKRRNETPSCIEMSPLGYFGILASAFLGWLAGPLVLFGFWYRSMPAHEWWMTALIGVFLTIGIWAMWESGASLWEKMAKAEITILRSPVRRAPVRRSLMAVLLMSLGLISVLRTEMDIWAQPPENEKKPLEGVQEPVPEIGSITIDFDLWADAPEPGEKFDFSVVVGPWQNWKDLADNRAKNRQLQTRIENWFRPVSATMPDVRLTELPDDWATRTSAMKGFFSVWCNRPDTPNCNDESGNNVEELLNNDTFQKEWNARRKNYLAVLNKPILKELDFSFANLRGAYLPGLDLRSVNLRLANLAFAQLEGVDLGGAELQGAILFKAQLLRTNFTEANMQAADLRGAEMQGAILTKAKVQVVDFSGANMQGTILTKAKMQRANFKGADLQGANLIEAEMQGAILTEANMLGVDLSGAMMQEAVLIEAEMQGAILTGANMLGANLLRASMQDVELDGAFLQGAVFLWAQMQRANLQGAVMRDASLQGAVLEETDLTNAQLNGAFFSGANLKNANLRGAVLQDTHLGRAETDKGKIYSESNTAKHSLVRNFFVDLLVFSGADLQGADLSLSQLTGTPKHPNVLDSTNLGGVNNNGGALRYVDLRRAIVDEQTDFRNSFGDGTVQLPASLKRPCQWGSQNTVYDDTEFFARWRGWLEIGPNPPAWSLGGPDHHGNIIITIPPDDPNCKWKTAP